MILRMARKLIRQYFYNYQDLKRKMKIYLAKRDLTFSSWIRTQEEKALKEDSKRE